FAQEAKIDDTKLIIDFGGKVYEENCDPCHANIANTDNYAGEIIFTHGLHLLVQCSSCHTQFPHRPDGTEVPTMKKCFECHGLKHGPRGLLANALCTDCHHTPREKLRPAFHTWDWAKKPHVEPGDKQLQTKCMMCHDEKDCVDCHEDLNIEWDPGVPYAYDSNGGCLSCHGDENLIKTSAGRPKSYQVLGVDESAHAGMSCQKCHSDYKYEDTPNPSEIWNVNAGYACRSCHLSSELFNEEQQARNAEVVKLYDSSIHAEEIGKGNIESATCASCHGGHYIQRLDTEAAQRALHLSAYRVCARCHLDEYDSYDDYYHGAAYKQGATDAPACWDCHAAHDILPSSDPDSWVSPKKVAETCRICHKGSEEAFVEKSGGLIHKKVEAAEENPLRQFLS
ncbi:MAG: cytochrome c3 family protein, partial [Actinomycetota bacterium]|nr:cytochrome c3 family protein [Actinomycetota bacterium]